MVGEDGDRFQSLEINLVPGTVQATAALAYTALRSDGLVENIADREVYRRHLDDGEAFEIIALRGALVVTAGAFVSWPSERESGAHIPRILDDVRVKLPKGQSNHARLETFEGVSHYLMHRLHRAFDPERTTRAEDWPIRIIEKT